MKNSTIFLAAALASTLITLPAWATVKPTQPGNTSSSSNASSNASSNSNSSAGAIGVGIGGAGGEGGSSSAQGGSVSVRTGSPTLRAEQSLNLSINHQAQERNPVASAIAPGLAVSNGTCFGTSGAGIQGASFGLSLGGPSLDEGCDTRYDAAALISVGEMDSAIERLCMKPEIREARKAANRPCLADRPHAGASFTNVCLDPSGQPYTDSLVAARACPSKPQD